MSSAHMPRMDCAVDATMSVIEGRWKTVILCRMIVRGTPLRFKELKEGIQGISARILTKQLKEMESDGLIMRMEFSESPPRVEYSITEKGRSLEPILKVLAEWGMRNVIPNRVIFDPSIKL